MYENVPGHNFHLLKIRRMRQNFTRSVENEYFCIYQEFAHRSLKIFCTIRIYMQSGNINKNFIISVKHVQLKLIVGVFERHRLSFTENSVTLDETEIEDVISDIYFAAHKETGVDFDVNLATKLAVHYILNTFDRYALFYSHLVRENHISRDD